jgi:hypothetical protein
MADDHDVTMEEAPSKRQRMEAPLPQAMRHLAAYAGSDPVMVPGCEVPGLIPYLKEGRTMVIDGSYVSKKSFRIREIFTHVIKQFPNARIPCLSVRITHSIDMLAQLKAEYGFESCRCISCTKFDNNDEDSAAMRLLRDI